ncbi:MAG TPA: TIGR00730 family Rossman fold protein [Thermoflexales bacterium]|nr:TIGR00730 family Rossman fold protein [Thermoflexales bacterium]HQZ21286.1 TIGR00730 family Rossman fold protein [Thermoflexales bacterium]
MSKNPPKSPIERKLDIAAQREASMSWQVFRIMSEFVEGLDFLSKVEKPITIFGSARAKPGEKYYELARATASALAQAGYAVITGGGPGIMEAGNKGASEAGGNSIGLNIELPYEQGTNAFVKRGISFRYFFSRKFMLDYSALAYVYLPGGFGTLDELFTVLTLVQTKKTDVDVPIVLMGVEFWQPLVAWIQSSLVERGLVSAADPQLLHLTDDPAEVLRLVKQAGEREFGED